MDVGAIGHYRLLTKLGEGGMGVVYAALDERLDRRVAIKMIRDASSDPVARERLWREARAAASVSHPNVCQLFEIGESAGELFIAMELLEGESLAARLARGPFPVAEAARTGLAILSALDALHQRGLIHRDLKPSNIFMTPVGLKLLDFGLARPIAPALDATHTDLTVAGTIVGTPQYLAPEGLLGPSLDARSDLFAVGAILYELLAGRPPFSGATVVQVLHAIMYEQPQALGGSEAIVAVDRVIRRALAKEPAQRYQTADGMADDLRRVLALVDSSDATMAARPITRLIVLPFRILRPDPETDFLAFSLPDAITTSLSGLESLVVRSSLTAARFGGDTPDLVALASGADIDAVLTGTQLRAGDRIRLNIQLVAAPAGTVLWSQTSDASLGDVFQLQDDLVRRIVTSLATPLTPRDQRALGRDVPASARAYELYLRANQLSTVARDWTVARDLYLECLAEDPNYAPAWARLGRIYRLLGAYGPGGDENLARAQEAFRRALDLNPDLTLAHNLATLLEVDIGQAQAAMVRLLGQARQCAGDAELFAGLVQACRYCGLLDASVAAHEQARRLDPHMRTSVAHAYLMLGQYQAAIEATVEDPPVPAVYALSLMGRDDEAIAQLKHAESKEWPRLIRLYLRATRLLLEGRTGEALAAVNELAAGWSLRDPCARFYLARSLARAGDARAVDHFRQAVEGGFFCWSFYARDPWLDGMRADPAFRAALRLAEALRREALTAFLQAEGDRVLGISAA